MSTVRDLVNAIRTRVPFEPIDIQESSNQLRIIARIRPDGTSAPIDNWMNVMMTFFKRMAQPTCHWKVDISKQYFPRGEKVVYAWRVMFQAENLMTLMPNIIESVMTAPLTSRAEVNEVPLLGASANRNDTTGGRKGAGVFGSVPTGPMAVRGR